MDNPQQQIKFTKRIGNLYSLVCDKENLRKAILEAAKHKKERKGVRRVLSNQDHYIKVLQIMLEQMTYTPAPYRIQERFDGIQKKKRTIAEPRFFPDQCIHHALIQAVAPVFMHGMYELSCGSIPKRGVHKAKRAIERWIRNDPKGTKYVLQMDIRRFYPSISHDVLKDKLRKRFKDPRVLWLMDAVIDSYSPGLPIGNYTSQWFCNFLLQDLDHFIKERLKVRHFVRYIDDIECFGPSKKALHRVRKAITAALGDLCLQVKKNWQVYPIKARALDFLGFRFYRNKTTLRKKIALRIRRKARKISKASTVSAKNASAMISYMGWIKHSDSRHFWKEYVRPYISLTELKGVISHEIGKHHPAARPV